MISSKFLEVECLAKITATLLCNLKFIARLQKCLQNDFCHMATTHPAIFLKFLCKVPDPTPNLTKNEELTPADTETQGGLVTAVPQATLRSPSCTPRLCAVDFLPEKHMRRLTEEKCALGLEREKSICVVRLESFSLCVLSVSPSSSSRRETTSLHFVLFWQKKTATHTHITCRCALLCQILLFLNCSWNAT